VSINTHRDSKAIIRAIEADGWKLARVTGSHHHFRHASKPGTVTVAHPKKDVPPGTLKSIERQSGLKLKGWDYGSFLLGDHRTRK
jgi:predicted RNA binding protein YcfA (HicA-like mRNA interferase family)